MKYLVILYLFILISCKPDHERPVEIRGWNILSHHVENALEVINASKDYDINHLELSHHLIMDLKHVRTDWRQASTNLLIDSAHHAGI